MAKVTKETAFLKVDKSHLHLGLEAAVLLAYIKEFEVQGKTCFASRAHIATELPMSESTVQRTIKKLVDAGYIQVIHRLSTRMLITI